MALFKIRKSAQKGADAPVAAVPPAQSIELMRRRAKHRLIGAAVLVLLGVVGFPLLFDSQPRPVMVDIPIEIPDKAKVKPLVMPPSVEPVASAPASAEPAASAVASVEAPPAAVAAPVHPVKPAPLSVAAPPAKPAASAVEEAKAAALLAGQEAPAAAVVQGRFVVQVGAFSDAAKLREVRQKLEKAGLKTYTQVVDTKDGKRTRVRVGPFTSQGEADKAATHIKSLALAASVLKM
jgi:DedD protein